MLAQVQGAGGSFMRAKWPRTRAARHPEFAGFYRHFANPVQGGPYQAGGARAQDDGEIAGWRRLTTASICPRMASFSQLLQRGKAIAVRKTAVLLGALRTGTIVSRDIDGRLIAIRGTRWRRRSFWDWSRPSVALPPSCGGRARRAAFRRSMEQQTGEPYFQMASAVLDPGRCRLDVLADAA